MTIPSLPPGFRFHPTDIELVKFYLTRKVLGKSFPVEAIAEVDIYKDAPWDLPSKACMRSKDLKWYFFCPRGRKYSTGVRTNRSTGFGCWKTTGNDKPVIYKGKIVGMRKSLVFHCLGEEAKKDRTDWVMHEYRLEDEDLKTKGVAQDAFVLCMIYKKDGPGPRNGAQYGAPFNEEEWDEDEEADVPFASGFAQEFILPDKRKHSVDIRIPDPKRYCVGSTSKACSAGPSQIVPSVVNAPPPAPPNDVTMEDRRNPCDEYLRSFGIFGDDIPAASFGNDKVENLDHINPDGNHKPEVTMDDIFNGLEDLGDSSAPYHHDNNIGVDASLLPPSETYMELKDFDAPLTSVDGPGPSGHNYSERYHSAFDHSVAAQSFPIPVISDDENTPGLGLKDLDIPLACGDALFSDLSGNEGLGGSVNIPNPLFCAQPFQSSEVTHVAEDFPWSSQYPQLEPVEGHVHMLQEDYGAEECTNQEIVGYGVGAATSFINNSNVGRTHACENLGRGEETIFCCTLQFLEHPRHPSSAVERPAPCTGAKSSDGHALFLLHGDSSFHVKAEVTLGEGGHGCTNDALSRGMEGFPFVTDCEENGNGSRNGAANCGCGILLSLVLLTLSGFYAFLAVRTSVIGDFHETFKLLFLDVVWLIDQIYVWCAFIELSLSSASPFALYAISFPFGIRSFEAPDITSSLLGTLISLVPEAVGSCLLLGLQLTHQCECADSETMNYLKTPREFLWPIDLVF